MSSLVPARPSSTVVLLRPAPDGEVEAFLLRRPPQMAAFADAWVFPGGKIDVADASPAAATRLVHGERDDAMPLLRDLAGDDLARAQANALRCCACRETFEETGIHCAVRRRLGTRLRLIPNPADRSPQSRAFLYRDEAHRRRFSRRYAVPCRDNDGLDVRGSRIGGARPLEAVQRSARRRG